MTGKAETAPIDDTPGDRAEALARLSEVRGRTMALAEPLSAEDQGVQTMPDVSPTKWHLAHTTWFFETFILARHASGYDAFDEDYGYLFNSYYKQVGRHHERHRRGILSRPPLEAIHAYRRHVEDATARLIETADERTWAEVAPLVTLGLNHEQQHQELILTDIKHVLASNPLRPAYQPFKAHGVKAAPELGWIAYPEGLVEIGHQGDDFAFDNESPRHKVWLEAFRIATRSVTNGEFMDFIADDGYRRPEFWLSDGWATVESEGWQAPLYWEEHDGGWRMATLSGVRAVDAAEPACHLSFFEADAYARWARKRLPTEAEWEVFAAKRPVRGTFADSHHFHPVPAVVVDADGATQVFGDVWEWTRSAYAPYPRYRPAAGAIGEYNGKFMSGQMVLRGGSAATPEGHVRATYRNFFYPPDRWQFSGLRLAADG